MSFMGIAGKVLSLAAIVALFLSVAPGVAYDMNKFPGNGSRADWEKACALCTQGASLSQQGKHQEAQDCYKKSLATYPLAVTYFDYAKDLKRLGKSQEAIENFERALKLAPDYYQAYSQMADAYLAQKKFEDAEKACRKSLELNPNAAEAMVNLAEACMGNRRLSEARKWLDKASKCPEAANPLCRAALKADYEKLQSLAKLEPKRGE